MATTYSISSTKAKYDGRYLKLTCTQTPQTGKGKSTINWTLTVTGGSYEWYTTGPTTVKIGSKQVYYKARTSYEAGTFPVAKGSTSGSFEVDHNADGSLSLAVSIKTAIYYSTTYTDSGTWTLDPVYTKADITSAPDFNDEGNPTITYNNPAGNDVDTLQACIADVNASIIVPYRDITKTGTTYTFNLTDAERKLLRQACSTANSMTVKFYVKTIIGDNDPQYSAIAKTMAIVNATPTFSASIVDEGVNSKVLTGDANNKIIKYFNYVKYSSGATALKEATIVSQSITSGSKYVANGSGYLSNTDSGTFVFTVKDSRGNENSTTITKTLINYVPLTCTFDAKNPTADGNMTLVIKGNYFNGSFGAKSNSLTVQYKILKDGAAYIDWTTVSSPTISGNTYTATVALTGLDYQSIYTIETRAQDEVLKCDSKYAPTTSNAKKFKTSPIFDWSDEDFAFNVPVNVSGNISTSGAISSTGNITTNGRLTGRFIPSYINANADLNSYRTPGMYYCDSNANVATMLNAPIAHAFALLVETHAGVVQTFTTYGAYSMRVYRRNYYDGTWGPWRTLADLSHPVGTVIITSTNTNPSAEYGGTWTLIDKGFNPGRINNPFTINSTNTTSATVNVHRSDHSITVNGTCVNKVAWTDTTQNIGTLNLASIGITQLPELMRFVGYTDGGNSMAQMKVSYDGVIAKDDIEYNLTSVAAGNTWVFSFTCVIDDSAMLDSACNRFYWRRDA